MNDGQIAKMRAFNRFYTSLAGVLSRKFLNGKFSLPELRVLHAIRYAEGITAGEIVVLLNIDKSYLSKIIIRFEKRKFLTKKVARHDARAYRLQLTALGKKEFGVYDRLSDEYVRQILGQLPGADCKRLVACMEEITGILGEVKL